MRIGSGPWLASELMNSETPRTDEQEFHEAGNYEVDWPSFARTLETENEKLREALRENLISGRIIKAENDQRGHIYAIDRDAKFIIARTEAALDNTQTQPRDHDAK